MKWLISSFSVPVIPAIGSSSNRSLGLDNQGAGQLNTLLHAVGQRGRHAIAHGTQSHMLERFFDFFLCGRSLPARAGQAENLLEHG